MFKLLLALHNLKRFKIYFCFVQKYINVITTTTTTTTTKNNANFHSQVSKIESEVLVEGWLKGRLEIVSFESTNIK